MSSLAKEILGLATHTFGNDEYVSRETVLALVAAHERAKEQNERPAREALFKSDCYSNDARALGFRALIEAIDYNTETQSAIQLHILAAFSDLAKVLRQGQSYELT